MENTLKRGDRVEVLKGKHRGKHGTYENETTVQTYPVLVVWLDGKREGSYFTPGDLKLLHASGDAKPGDLVSGETKANPTA